MTAPEVVLACDGFGNNPRSVAPLHARGRGRVLRWRQHQPGDAITWGSAVGAGLRNMTGYLGHGQVVVGHGTRLNPNLVFLGALLVDRTGRRFCDETAQGYSKLAGLVCAGYPGEKAVLIWDEPAHAARHALRTHARVGRCATRSSATTRWPSSLAGLQLPGRTLAATLHGFRARLTAGAAAAAAAGRPWYAAWITHGILATQGGLTIEPTGASCVASGSAIAGLSAAGGAATGISGPSPDGYSSGNGLLAALGLGWIIGNRLATPEPMR